MDYEILIRFLLAALWGGMVGAEREYRSKSAGFRTMIMISIGACFFTIMSTLIGAPGNPDRIAANIVTGIGFLGAGVIFRGENQINGITTAATTWGVAAVGMGIGAGYYGAAAAASVLILIVLAILPYVESYIGELNQTRMYSVKYLYADCLNEILETWQVQGHGKNQQRFVDAVLSDDKIRRFEY